MHGDNLPFAVPLDLMLHAGNQGAARMRAIDTSDKSSEQRVQAKLHPPEEKHEAVSSSRLCMGCPRQDPTEVGPLGPTHPGLSALSSQSGRRHTPCNGPKLQGQIANIVHWVVGWINFLNCATGPPGIPNGVRAGSCVAVVFLWEGEAHSLWISIPHSMW